MYYTSNYIKLYMYNTSVPVVLTIKWDIWDVISYLSMFGLMFFLFGMIGMYVLKHKTAFVNGLVLIPMVIFICINLTIAIIRGILPLTIMSSVNIFMWIAYVCLKFYFEREINYCFRISCRKPNYVAI